MDQNNALKSYDRLMAALDGIPDCARSRPTTIRTTHPLLGNVETFIVQTFRQKDEGDIIFIEHTGPEGYERYYLPAAVAKVLQRHRDQLTTQNQRRVGREQAEARKAAGIEPFKKAKA